MRGLRGRRYLVAGGGSGIGDATAHRLAEEGASVIVADRDGAAAGRVAASIGSSACGAQYDQSDEASISELFHSAVAGGLPLNGVAIVAGVHPGAIPFAEISESALEYVYRVNVFGVLRMVQHAARAVDQDRHSALVVVGSVAGVRPEIQDAVYASSKAAAHAIVRSAALEFAAQGLRVNSVLPGSVITPLAVSLTSVESIEREARRTLPMGLAAHPSEVASAIAFLLSEDASHMTGTELIVDGGLFANSP